MLQEIIGGTTMENNKVFRKQNWIKAMSLIKYISLGKLQNQPCHIFTLMFKM